MHFTDGGGNVLVAADVLMSSDVRRLAALSGVDFDRQGSKVIDHMSFSKEVDSPEALHTAVLSMQLVHNDYILGKAHLSGKGVIFRSAHQMWLRSNARCCPPPTLSNLPSFWLAAEE